MQLLCGIKMFLPQLLKKEDGLTVTVADFVEACRVTVKLLARRRTQLRDSLALFKGGMDVSCHMADIKGIFVGARRKHMVTVDTRTHHPLGRATGKGDKGKKRMNASCEYY